MKPLTVLPIPSVCRNLAERFETCVQQHPEKEAFIFLEVSTSAECMILTYIQPREKALAIAITLQAERACGERVLLIYKPGLEFIAAFLGCIYAGAIAVPACPPRKNHHFERLQGILHNAQAKLVLTTFHVEEGRPIQRIHSERSLQLSVLHRDAGFPSAEEIQFLVSQLSAPRFNLETDLLLRAQLVQWQNRQSALILVIHHIISDAWSVGVLIQELLTLYPRLCVGQLIDLPALPIQYSDFAVWHRQTIAAGLEPNLVYWRSKLAHAPQELTLPTDTPRPAQPTFRGRTYHQKFESSLGTALKTLSKQAGVTLFMTLMGAYSLLLNRYSGQSDLLIGSTFAARQQPQVQPLIGLFLNTLVFRIDTSGNPTVQELLTQVKQVALEAFAHPEIPFEELSAHLPSAERRNSWFQAMFILQTIPRPALSVPDLLLTLVPVSGVGAKCDLALWMEDSPDGLRAEWEYNCDLFEFTTIERIAAQFNQLLAHLVQDLQRSIAQLPVLSPRELQWLESSIGKPKGVMISHRGAVNTNLDINQRFAIQPSDRVIALASLSFDLSVYDLFGFLAAGAAIVLPHAQEALNPTRWLQLMHQHQVTFWNTAPAVMEMLMASVTRQAQCLPDSLRMVMMSGDAISVTLPDQIRSFASSAIQVYSFGGATEGSIWSICYAIDRVEPEWTSIPYGKPIDNQRFHILDAQLNPVPVGVAGELHIGGTGVALGYFRRPELTAARFIADPFFSEPNARLYKTGDRGRYLPDGTIQFLGRMDYQVKIRGFRIELGEIEAAVTQYAGVREAAILVREDVPGSKLLCAYVVAQPGEAIEVAGLRQALRQKLPDYMVPSFILLLDGLPLTANGKVDRKALPKPEAVTADRSAIALPQTQLERQIAQIWAEHLQIEAIGLHDNFFDLGGHSLLMVKIHSELQTLVGSELKTELNIVDLFQFPTIATLVSHLQHQAQHQTTKVSATEQAQQRTQVRTAQVQTLQQATAQHRRSLRQQFRTLSEDD